MPKNLLIVESPAKAKTIEKILGKDYKVMSSFGHIRDLEKGSDAVSIQNNFQPHYVVTPDKRKLVNELKSEVAKSETVWLATDEDREGEAISWHLCEVLGLSVQHTKRIVFREITAPAIQKAVLNPRTVDVNLVDAQQARRVLDRLVGYELSSVLWKKVKGGLSAGRVQSVTVKLVVEREREIMAFSPTPFFRVNAIFAVRNEQGKVTMLKAENPHRFDDEAGARVFLEKCKGAQYPIRKIEVKPTSRKPAPPFTTSTLQQEASRKLYMNVNRTMSVAQKLYEQGLITYMRTDSTSLSETAMAAIEDEIKRAYGPPFSKPRRFKSKQENAQEAHEAIRPTYIDRHTISSGDRDEQRLYDLIWKRTIASQMADAILEKTTVDIGISTQPEAVLKASGEVMKFEGFLKVYLESKDDDEEDEDTAGILPPLVEGQLLNLSEMIATERFTRPPSRYTEAALVSKLEELGIGRPSTYAPTVSKIMDPVRGYVTRENREGESRNYQVLNLQNDEITTVTQTEITGAVKNRLFASDIGMAVSDFLDEHFDEIMDYQFTADIEKEFDKISEGKVRWTQMMKDFYFPFHELVEKTVEEADRVTGERILGKDPATGKTVLVRLSRRGPVIQLGASEELLPDEKPKYANFPTGLNMEEIDLEQALKLMELPKLLGTFEGQEVVIGQGRYGPYVKWGDGYISLPAGEDPYCVEMERAQEIIEEKKKADAPVATYQGLPITQGSGRFGPFLKWNNLFANIPARINLKELTPNEMIEIVAAKAQKEANRYIKRWEVEGIDIEEGRWGPFIRFKKLSVKIPKINGQALSREEAQNMELEEVKALILAEVPNAFDEPKKAATKKTDTKKTDTKKATVKKASPKKATTRKASPKRK